MPGSNWGPISRGWCCWKPSLGFQPCVVEIGGQFPETWWRVVVCQVTILWVQLCERGHEKEIKLDWLTCSARGGFRTPYGFTPLAFWGLERLVWLLSRVWPNDSSKIHSCFCWESGWTWRPWNSSKQIAYMIRPHPPQQTKTNKNPRLSQETADHHTKLCHRSFAVTPLAAKHGVRVGGWQALAC